MTVFNSILIDSILTDSIQSDSISFDSSAPSIYSDDSGAIIYF